MQKHLFSEKISSQANLAIFSGQVSYLLGPSKLSSFFLPYFSGFCSIVRSTTNSVAMANATAWNCYRNGMRRPSQPIAFFRAVVLHLPSQYIFISLCSISALPLAVLLLRAADSCLSLCIGNAKAWYSGISCRCFSHVFFVSVTEFIINRWSRGKW